MAKIKVKIRRSPASKDLPLPRKASQGSSGYDLYACVDDEITIEPGRTALIPTGIFLEIPPGYEAQIRPRSGLALKHGVTVINSPGTIDSDYRGEVCVIIINHGKLPFTIKRGERIAQLVFAPVCEASFVEVPDLEPTDRGKGGFGHTGVI